MALSFFLEIQKLDDSKNMNIKKVSLEANRFQVFIEGEMIKYWRDLGESLVDTETFQCPNLFNSSIEISKMIDLPQEMVIKRHFISEEQLRAYIGDLTNYSYYQDEITAMGPELQDSMVQGMRGQLIENHDCLKPEWQLTEISDGGVMWFIQDFEISTVEVTASLNLHSGSSDEDDFGVAGMLSFLSGGFEGCTLQFRGLKLSGLYEDTDTIVKKMLTHYRNEGLNNLSTVIGSLNIFGNPHKFFKDIGSSLDDLTDSTAELEAGNMIVDTAGLIQTGVAG
jgi:hypothetical protein